MPACVSKNLPALAGGEVKDTQPRISEKGAPPLQGGDRAAVLKAVQAGFGAEEHAAFVSELKHRRNQQRGQASGN